ncbi:putative Squamosa promoter-binding-like protein 4 [Nannochloris sp. 'desiccata']|nr:putative Squamosa promoter-binding-like protein 4 [Chlorella desiccata (nom. nud.)]
MLQRHMNWSVARSYERGDILQTVPAATMSDSEPTSNSTPAEALEILQAAEDRSAWGHDDYSWDPQTCKANSKSTSPKDHHPCSAPANLTQVIPQISSQMKPKANSSDSAPPGAPTQDTLDCSGANATAAATLATKQASSASYGRPGYCQADGCGKKLSKLTFYHVRNKICDVHIKTDQFCREGVFLRFCQRCGYPHPLDEFDGTKHSCRAQLEKHNARRRKRQTEAAAQKGGKQEQIVAAACGAAEDGQQKEGDLGFAVAIKSKEQQPNRRSSRRHKTRFTAAEVEWNEDDEEEDQLVKLPRRPAATKAAPAASQKAQQSREKRRSASPSLPFLDFNASDLFNPSGELQQRRGAPLGTSTATEQEQEPPLVQIDDLSSWLNTHLAELEDFDPSILTSSGALLPPLPQGTSTFHFASGLLHPHNAAPPAAPAASSDGEVPSTSVSTEAPPVFNNASILGSILNPFHASALPTAAAPTAAATPKLTKEAILSTVSVKLFGCTPAELPNDLRQQLATWFNGHTASIEGYLRPGCVHLTVQATVEVEARAERTESGKAKRKISKVNDKNAENVPLHMSLVTTGGVSCLVDKMFASGEPLWRSKTLLVQAGNEVALVHDGKLNQIWQIGSTLGERAVPAVLETKPAVLLATSFNASASPTTTPMKTSCCGGGAKKTQQEIIVKGVNLLQDACEIVCRLQGEYVVVEKAGCAECRCSASVKSCCQSSNGAGVGISSEWENTCCGCCISKLASLSVSKNKPEGESKSKKKKSSSSCCATESVDATEAIVDTVTPQLISLKLDSGRSQLRPGVLHIDVLKNTFMAPQGGRILVVDSPAVHSELLNLTECAPAAATAWIDALGIVFEWVGDRQKIEFSLVERTAAKLLHEALGYGLVEVAKYLYALLQAELMAAASSFALPQEMDGLDALAFLSQADQICKSVTLLRITKLGGAPGNDLNNDNTSIQSTMSLLHLAVQSQNPAVVELVLGWGRESEVLWRCDLKGPYNLTPLHLAALASDPVVSAQLVLTLVASCEPGVQAWKEAMTSDGSSPADFALRLGRVGMLATFGKSVNENQQRQQQQRQDEEEKEDVFAALATIEIEKKEATCALEEEKNVVRDAVEAPATPHRCKCTGPCPCAMSAEPCASCSFGSSDDDGCCGSENGQCCCCSGGKTQEEAEMQKGGVCCAATTLARACCQ